MTAVAAVLLGVLLGGSACAPATVNRSGAQATARAPESQQVAALHIPYDPAYPKYVVTVEPLRLAPIESQAPMPQDAGRIHYGYGAWGWILPQGPDADTMTAPPTRMSSEIGSGTGAQLETALTNVGNLVVIDYDFYQQNQGNPGKLVGKGERGPFIIRGSVTEFSEVAEAESSGTGGSLGALGAALAIGGAIGGSDVATYTGAGLALANPTYKNTTARRTGSVGMDLKVVDARSGRLLGGLVANGTFTSESAANGFSLFGFGTASNAFAASALGQATRAAMNSATEQITQKLERAVH